MLSLLEGMEAGGHIGKLTTMTLVRQVSKRSLFQLSVLVVLQMVQERLRSSCLEQMLFKWEHDLSFLKSQMLTKTLRINLKAKDIDTVVSASVVGHPVRAIKNKLASAYNQS